MNWDYITGFFDADGSVTAISNNKGKNKTIQVSFHNNERTILEEIQKFILIDIGVKGFISKKDKLKEHHGVSFELKYSYQSGLKVANKLMSIHPKKKHRIETYNLIQAKTKRNGKYTDEEQQERNTLVMRFFQIEG